nr:ferritin-like fold-containing protein [Fodinicola feengrottensis]
MLAYGTLIGFDRMAADARLAPDLRRRAVLAVMAADEMRNYELLAVRLDELGADPETAMAPFAEPLEAFHGATAPRTWLEGLIKAYVGDGIADDFYREVAEFLPEEADRTLVQQVLHDTRHADFAVAEVRARRRGRPVGGRPARAVGPAAGRRGVQPGAAGRGRTGGVDRSGGRRLR